MIVITLNKYTVKVKVIFLFCLLGISCMLKAADKPIIKIETDCTSLIFQVGDNGRLYQRYLGKKLNHESDFVYLPQEPRFILHMGQRIISNRLFKCFIMMEIHLYC